ncbi:MAG: nitroreductase family protein [Bacillota bacterium]
MLLDLIKKRASIRSFSNKMIPDDVVEYIIEAGRLSPSGGNEQPWKFGIVTNEDLINDIANAAYNQTWIKEAQLLIILCAKISSDSKGGRNIQLKRFPEIREKLINLDKEVYSKLNLEEHQTKIPGTQMVLAAVEHGIGSTWISYFEVEKVSEILNIKKGYIPSEIIAFGYPKSKKDMAAKKEKSDIIFFNNNFNK